MTSPLISAADLAARLGEPGLRILDASWHLDGRDAKADFESARIPGALFFDLEASSDPHSPYPHMLPPPGEFTGRLEALGLNADDRVVAMILVMVGVPAEGIGLILGVDRFLDMCRTTLNVTGDLVLATVVSRGESDDIIPEGTPEPVAPGA
jgi:hypothetical protein